MITKRKSLLISIAAILLALTMGLYFIFASTKSTNISVRTIELNRIGMDYQSVLSQFEDSEIKKERGITSFIGYKTLDVSMFEDIDNISDDEISLLEGAKVKYYFSYDEINNIVTISAHMESASGEIHIDNISGEGFINEYGEVDAYMIVEDEVILLSEMQNAGMIENCGWFSRLVKRAVKTVVTAVVVVAVVVATGGVGAAAVAAGVVTYLATDAAIYLTEKTIADNNRKHNLKQVQPKGYIYGQDHYSSWKYGKEYLHKNGCGVIALYNTLYKLGKNPSLVDLIYEFETNNGTFALGKFGSDPTHFAEYFLDKKIDYKKYYSFSSLQKAADAMSTEQMIILEFWLNPITDGAHYVAIEKTAKNNLIVYNYSNKDITTTPISKIDKTMFNKIILAYMVG